VIRLENGQVVFSLAEHLPANQTEELLHILSSTDEPVFIIPNQGKVSETWPQQQDGLFNIVGAIPFAGSVTALTDVFLQNAENVTLAEIYGLDATPSRQGRLIKQIA